MAVTIRVGLLRAGSADGSGSESRAPRIEACCLPACPPGPERDSELRSDPAF